MVKNQATKQRAQRILGDCWQWETNGQCVKGDNCSFRHDTNKRGKVTPSNPSPNSFMQQSERKSSRNRSPRGRSPSGRTSRWPCKDFLRGTCNNSFCEKWHPPACLFYKTKSGCRFGEKCSFAHRQVDEQPTKRSKKNDDKSAVAMLKKGNLQEREPVTDECHDRPGKLDKKSDKKLGQKSSKRRSSDARQFGLRISGHDVAEVYSPEGHRHAEANPTCETHKGYCTSHQNSRPKSFRSDMFAQVNLISAAPTLHGAVSVPAGPLCCAGRFDVGGGDVLPAAETDLGSAQFCGAVPGRAGPDARHVGSFGDGVGGGVRHPTRADQRACSDGVRLAGAGRHDVLDTAPGCAAVTGRRAKRAEARWERAEAGSVSFETDAFLTCRVESPSSRVARVNSALHKLCLVHSSSIPANNSHARMSHARCVVNSVGDTEDGRRLSCVLGVEQSR